MVLNSRITYSVLNYSPSLTLNVGEVGIPGASVSPLLFISDNIHGNHEPAVMAVTLGYSTT